MRLVLASRLKLQLAFKERDMRWKHGRQGE